MQVGVGNVNAVSGEAFETGLRANPQNYMVCPDQPWLDGIRAQGGRVRQFVAVPLGKGYTVEGQLTGREEFGGIQIKVYEPKPGIFPEEPLSLPGHDSRHLRKPHLQVSTSVWDWQPEAPYGRRYTLMNAVWIPGTPTIMGA